MGFLETIYFVIGAILFTNFFYALLYLLSRSAGEWLFNGFCKYSDCLGGLLLFPLMGFTSVLAEHIYDRFNWFVARLLILLYALLLLFILFFLLIILVS